MTVRKIRKIRQSTSTLSSTASVIDTLTSTSKTDALSSNQGKVLNDNHKAIKLILSGSNTGEATINNSNILSVSMNRRGCIVGQSTSTNTKPWYKFASCSVSNSYTDRNITFYVYPGYSDNSEKLGILQAHFRTNSSSAWESGQLKWLYKTLNINASNFMMVHNTASPCIVELWCKCDVGYQLYHFDALAEGSRSDRHIYWTLYDTISAGSADAPTSGYTQITSTVNVPHIQINTRNTSDTYIPVLKSGELQYTTRVLATSKTHTNYNTEQDRLPTLSFLSCWNGAYNSSNSSNLTYAHQRYYTM